jgi:hypothetical protein
MGRDESESPLPACSLDGDREQYQPSQRPCEHIVAYHARETGPSDWWTTRAMAGRRLFSASSAIPIQVVEGAGTRLRNPCSRNHA